VRELRSPLHEDSRIAQQGQRPLQWVLHKRYENRRDSSTKRRSYAYMKYTYESMWASWSANAHCGDWARAFFAKMEAYEMFVIVGFFKRKYFWNVD
jgi:hypothetical protein